MVVSREIENKTYEGIPSIYYLSMSVIERLNAMYIYTVDYPSSYLREKLNLPKEVYII